MQDKLVRFRKRISSNNKYDEEFLEKIREVPVYDLFTPTRTALLCEKTEFEDMTTSRFLEHDKTNNLDVVKFFVSLGNKDKEFLYNTYPFKMYLRYNVEDKDLPHYGKHEYKVKIHYSTILSSIDSLKENFDIERKDLENLSDEDFPGFKIRGTIEERSK